MSPHQATSDELTPERARELLSRLHVLTAEIQQNVARHTQMLRAGPLPPGHAKKTSDGQSPPGSVPPATLAEATGQLEAQLAAAHAEIKQQRALMDYYLQAARTDGLTNVRNRRAFEDDLQARLAQWKRQAVPLSLMLVDIDHFKSVNDEHGHPAGDAALRWTAEIISATVRNMDLVARFGGEEFAVILPGTPLAKAFPAARRVHRTIEQTRCRAADTELHLTVSVGLATAMADDAARRIVARADAALYAAKRNGRNCIFAHHGDGEPAPVTHTREESPRSSGKPVRHHG